MYDQHFSIYNLIAELRGTNKEVNDLLPKGMTDKDLTISDEEILAAELTRDNSGKWVNRLAYKRPNHGFTHEEDDSWYDNFDEDDENEDEE